MWHLMLTAWNWLLSLPPGIASAIVGGLFTFAAASFAFIGVALSLWAHRWRERVAREHEMRREAYFNLAASTARMFEFIRQIANHQLPDADLRLLIKDYGPDSSKLHLVGDVRSLKSLYQMDEKFQEAMSALAIKRFVVLNLKSGHDAINRNLSEVVDRMKNLRPIGTTENADAIAQLGLTWRNLIQRERDLGFQIRKQTLEIHREANKYLTAIIPLQIEAVLAARNILAFDVDEATYVSETQKSLERLNAGLEALCNRLEADLNREIATQTTTIEDARSKSR